MRSNLTMRRLTGCARPVVAALLCATLVTGCTGESSSLKQVEGRAGPPESALARSLKERDEVPASFPGVMKENEKTVPCPQCRGDGSKRCSQFECREGIAICHHRLEELLWCRFCTGDVKHESCGGTGKLDEKCPECNGSGRVTRETSTPR